MAKTPEHSEYTSIQERIQQITREVKQPEPNQAVRFRASRYLSIV